MMYQVALLDTHVSMRYDVYPGGAVEKSPRIDPRMMYGTPRTEDAFIWPERADRFVIVLRNEVRDQGDRSYGCYYVMPSLEAAVMFVFAAI